MPISEPFRLLDLPREVRDEIYRGMLCDWRKDAAPGHILVNGTVRFAPMRRRIEANILLANKQIYQEAKLVLLQENQFVLVKIGVRARHIIRALFLPSQVPVVTARRDCAAVFKDHVVMTHFIDFYLVDFFNNSNANFRRIGRIDLILLHRDLPQFCKAVTRLDLLGRHFVHSKHEVTIHNPFAVTLSPHFLNRKNQERLLEPYTRELRGFDDFNIDGHVQTDLAEEVVAKVQEEPPPPDPEKFLEDLLHQKELGDQALHGGDQKKASKIWKDATFSLLQASKRRTWPRLKEAGGGDFTDRVSELAFQIESNQAQSSLEAMRGIPLQIQISEGWSYFVDTPEWNDRPGDLMRRMDYLATDLQRACSDAEKVGTLLGTGWTPSDEQLARVCYSLAQGLRLFELNVDLAERKINRAAELVPDDPLIQAEAQQIRVWKARVQGGWTV
ncbi:hypothetical protein INS49_015666 [Diaporthe citri]|uniref:uncharacterized protein n=1 Tax=Diaporthe citri TaxID=83186 RepID=UPI001C7F43AC|nr:uncharacterized protein INS49_015666 [Diaporthe citri]KAG6356279.1 hypothetical protein INS49_015666 [Diaporthe citri]